MSNPYPLYPVVYYDDFAQFAEGLANRYGDRIAITAYNRQGEESTYTYRRLRDDSLAFAKALWKNGLQGKNIAIVSENSYEWLVSFLGITYGGGVAVCIDIEQSEDSIHEMLSVADTKAMVVSEALLPVCLPVTKQPQILRTVIVGVKGVAGFDAFLDEGYNAGDYVAPAVDKDQPAQIVFTSGTTGASKPVLLSHYALLTNAADALAMVTSKELTSFALLPFYHTYGFTCSVLATLDGGYNVCICGDLKTLLRDMGKFKPELIMAVPLVAETFHKFIWSAIEKAGMKSKVKFAMKAGKLLGNPNLLLKSSLKEKFKGTALEKLKIIVCGGAHISRSVSEDLLAFGIVVLQGYGITECAPLVSVNRNKSFDLGSVGYVVPGYQVRIKDEEIQVKGKSMMNGYYKDDELTAQSFEDGWFKTGDIGYIDKRGHLFIQGRKKNLIVMKNGKKISPEEIESAVRSNTLVKDVVAYGANAGDSADDVKLAVTVYPDPVAAKGMSSFDILDQIQHHVDTLNAKLPTYKQIQMINVREQDFQRTASHKIKREAI
jgi:long-chain acyl-CoA synthetase